MQVKSRIAPPRPTRKQLREILSIACAGTPAGEPRTASTYEPLAWLLRSDVGNRRVRSIRRSLYRKLVRDLAREFNRIYRERLASANGPWEFPGVYRASQRARNCVRRMRWCAWKHAFRLPGAGAASVREYQQMLGLFEGSGELIIRAADPSIA